jgi:hypothetical protein
MLHGYICMFQVYVPSVSDVCCKSRYECCIYMLAASVCFKCFQLLQTYVSRFHLDVAFILQQLHMFFSGVSDVCCKCFSCFGRMLQVFHLNVEKVDWRLHMLQWDC